ncbi:hypothetical protein FQA39_LY16166 [Lamprigera yunnana]|nr:hypothetical protein FQA39_LY16166 [Lamprigera yunnana]
MDKLTLISGTLFMAADVFAIVSLAMPDWIITDVGGDTRLGLMWTCMTLYNRPQVCFTPDLQPEWLLALVCIFVGCICITTTIILLASSHWDRNVVPYARWVGFTAMVLFCLAAVIFPMGFHVDEIGGQPYQLPNSHQVGISYILFVLALWITVISELFAGQKSTMESKTNCMDITNAVNPVGSSKLTRHKTVKYPKKRRLLKRKCKESNKLKVIEPPIQGLDNLLVKPKKGRPLKRNCRQKNKLKVIEPPTQGFDNLIVNNSVYVHTQTFSSPDTETDIVLQMEKLQLPPIKRKQTEKISKSSKNVNKGLNTLKNFKEEFMMRLENIKQSKIMNENNTTLCENNEEVKILSSQMTDDDRMESELAFKESQALLHSVQQNYYQ